MNWKEIIKSNFNGPHESRPKFYPPALPADVKSTEKRLSLPLPKSLVNFLLETNGASVTPDPKMPAWTYWLVVKTSSLRIDRTLSTPMLVIGNNDCGDTFGFQLDDSGKPASNVRIWTHDERCFEDYGSLKGYILNEIDYTNID